MQDPFIHLARLAPVFMAVTFLILIYHFFAQTNKVWWAIGLTAVGGYVTYRALTGAG